MSPRLVFQAHGRRGLGHLMRSMNIAREVLELVPDAEIVVHARVAADPGFVDPRVRLVTTGSWEELLSTERPDVAVHDTMLPEDPNSVPAGVRCAFVLRARRAELHDELADHPFLGRLDLVIVPHAADEFDRPLPAAVADRTVFVGPIVRRPDPVLAAGTAREYGLDGSFVVVSTAGGGGFAETAIPFCDAALAAHRALTDLAGSWERPLRHVLVLGPNSGHDVAVLPGLTVVRSDPRMIELLSLADLVISEAGYNTVQELRVVGTSAVLVPGDRRIDDQHERAAAVAALGLAVVAPAVPPSHVADAAVALATDPRAREAMRAAATEHPVRTGNRAAAERLLELAGVDA